MNVQLCKMMRNYFPKCLIKIPADRSKENDNQKDPLSKLTVRVTYTRKRAACSTGLSHDSHTLLQAGTISTWAHLTAEHTEAQRCSVSCQGLKAGKRQSSKEASPRGLSLNLWKSPWKEKELLAPTCPVRLSSPRAEMRP